MVDHLRRVVCQVEEQCDTLHTAVLLEVASEESTGLQVDTHGTEDNGEVVVMVVVYALGRLANQTSLSTDLRGDFVVGKTGGGEDGNLLTTSDRVHRVNGRDTSRDHFFGVDLAKVSRIARQTRLARCVLENKG